MNINSERLLRMLKELGAIGFADGKGTSRMAYTKAFHQGRDYVKTRMEEAGMKVEIDSIGNLIGRLEGRERKTISLGSHIDTVPDGGIYDGALGVLAGIEAVHTLRENGYENRYSLEVVAFTEEEGNVVGGTFGSKAFTGQPQEEDAIKKLDAVGLKEEDAAAAKRDPSKYLCYLELHIEQGGVLEKKQIPVGVVEGIFGIARYRVVVTGKANHAGSTPMDMRDDALVRACAMIGRMVEISEKTDPAMTCTIGWIHAEPGAANVIPGRVEFCIELRCMETGHIKQAVQQFEKEFAGNNCHVENFLWQGETVMDSGLKELLRQCLREREISWLDMPSGAGHDTINMALFTPSAMLFIPSIDGVSHSIEERSLPKDIETGGNILLDAILKIDQKKGGEYG